MFSMLPTSGAAIMIFQTRFLVSVAALLMLPCATGCSSSVLNLGFGIQSKLEQETAENRVIELITAWQEGEGPGINNQAVTRGFSGQVYFITEGRGLPSEVKGGIRVYLFDDQGTPEEQKKPIYQFDFTPEAWQLHSTMTKLGPAYTVFIPYTRSGGHLAECALRIRYTPPSGPAVYSKMVSLTLGGAKRLPAVTDSTTSETSDDPVIGLDGSMTIKSPTNPRRSGLKSSSILQAGAEEDSNPVRKPKINRADWEDDVDQSTSTSAPLDHAQQQSNASEPPQAQVKQTALFADEDIIEPTVRSYSIPLD